MAGLPDLRLLDYFEQSLNAAEKANSFKTFLIAFNTFSAAGKGGQLSAHFLQQLGQPVVIKQIQEQEFSKVLKVYSTS